MTLESHDLLAVGVCQGSSTLFVLEGLIGISFDSLILEVSAAYTASVALNADESTRRIASTISTSMFVAVAITR